jgi:GNAT superfamily N-acetyltransferase
MQASFRQYNHATDYQKVGEFLTRTFGTEGGHINWLQPRWEYMHYHPNIREVDLNLIGVWEANGEIVGVVHPEHGLGTAYFEIDPSFVGLKTEMLKYAEEHLSALNEGVRQLRVYINDNDDDFKAVASEIGYVKSDRCEPMSQIVLPGSNPIVSLPDGFRLKSLKEENDLRKIDRVMWRGFNHGDEPPEGGIEDRKFMQSAPNFREDLNIVVEAPDGNFVSYCGMWFEPVNRIAYVEPVATDPDYRRMGLARAAILEGVRRCGELGATVAYVGSTMPVYLSIGFRQAFNCSEWQREWE